MVRILTNDGLEAAAIKELQDAGVEVVNEHIEAEVLGEELKSFDGVVVRSATKITKDILDKEDGGKLKLVVRAGVGVDNIDLVAAKDKGITVRNTPNASSNSVAELALAHMFAVARFVNISNVTMRNGEWNKKKYKGVELSGKTLGIIGMGRIGRSLAEKATSLGMTVVYTDLFGKQENLPYDFYEMKDLLGKADFISLHVPYDKTKGALIGEEEFKAMKDGVYLVNCARGKVVDEKALLDALNSGKVAGAAVDVFEQEPTLNEELVNHPNVSVTPHIGASTKEAQDRIGKEVASTIKEFFNI
ncbi:MAG: D-2-hydroxyacid dehydrogenase [Clostridiaceae bacterium]|nr:D-2-hydroxyacid dehydrogenase [Clostridiaceae bacterium]